MEIELLTALVSGLAAGFALSFAVGLVVGFFSGLLGIGGGTMLVPTFKLGFAMDAIASTATSLFTIVPTSIAGFVAHIRRRTCVPKIGIAAGLAGAVTSPLGVLLASHSQDWMIMAAAAIVIGYTSFTMLRKALKMPKQVGGEAKACDGFSVQVTSSMVLRAALVGMVAGVVSGYVGVGGGFLMVPLFIRVLDIPMKLTSGTSLIAVMILAIPGVVYQGILGNVDWVAGIAVALGSVPGAMLGARFVPRVPEKTLRILFGCFLLFAAILLVVNQLA